ncbi:MAG: energy-coupling factor ABC transporter permease [Pseudomonadota bacterium]
MHIEPGIVEGAKIALSFATAAGAAVLAAKVIRTSIDRDGGAAAFLLRSTLATLCVLGFFELLFKYPIGVSEVHLILGATLFLIFGAGPTACGLGLGLLMQGLFFAPADLPQYFMNVTTLIVPLWAVSFLAQRIIPANTAYVDLRYRDVLALSASYQGGIIAWVAFWAFYGQGFGSENLANVFAFGVAYLSVIVLEPLVDLAVLAAAKATYNDQSAPRWVTQQLYHPAPR